MSQKTFVQAVLVAVCATAVVCASPAIAAECLTAVCVTDEDHAGGVPDGNFASDAVVVEPPAPSDPAPSKAQDIKDDGGAGSAIFSPFAGARDPQKSPSPLTWLLANDGRAAAVAIALVIALVTTLIGVAAFTFLQRRRSP